MSLSLQQVGLLVKQLQWAHQRSANRSLVTVGLSLAQWDMLRHLHERPESSLHDLALLTFQTDQAMGGLAARMVDRGLVERVEGPGRAVRHRVTEPGTRARQAGNTVMDRVFATTLGRLDDDERGQLYTLLSKSLAES